MADPDFTSSDAWLLYSVYSTTGTSSADLRQIIMHGDAVNHAIFTAQELRRGFAKLISAGLVAQDGANYCTTSQGIALVQMAAASFTSWPHPISAVLATLGGSKSDYAAPDFEDPAWPFLSLTDEAVGAAVAAYSAEFWAAYDKLGPSGAA